MANIIGQYSFRSGLHSGSSKHPQLLQHSDSECTRGKGVDHPRWRKGMKLQRRKQTVLKGSLFTSMAKNELFAANSVPRHFFVRSICSDMKDCVWPALSCNPHLTYSGFRHQGEALSLRDLFCWLRSGVPSALSQLHVIQRRWWLTTSEQRPPHSTHPLGPRWYLRTRTWCCELQP